MGRDAQRSASAKAGLRSWIAIPLLCTLSAGAAAPEPVSTWPFQGAPRDEAGRFEKPSGPVRRAGPLVTIPFLFRRVFARLREPAGLPERVEPPRRSRAAAEEAGLHEEDVWLLRIGETRRF